MIKKNENEKLIEIGKAAIAEVERLRKEGKDTIPNTAEVVCREEDMKFGKIKKLVTRNDYLGLIMCIFCKKLITNNTIKPLVCICEQDNFFHLECYEKSNNQQVDKVIKAFDKAKIKFNVEHDL